MNYILDCILVILFFLVVLIWYIRGFARSVSRLFSLAGSVILAGIFGSQVGQRFLLGFWEEKSFSEDYAGLFADISGYVAVFCVSVIVLGLIGAVIERIARNKIFRRLDSVLGFLFGIVCGLLIVFVVCVGLSLFIELNLAGEAAESVREVAEHSFVFRFFCDIAPFRYINITSILSSVGS